MTPLEHRSRAEELVAKAMGIYGLVIRITDADGGLEPNLHAGLFREMRAVTALAQVHATLAATSP